MYLHDGADVRQPQGLAARTSPSSVAVLDNSRERRADCETSSGWIDHIDRDVELAGDLDDTQRQRLLHIAERCLVHQTLTLEVDVATSLA
jgi:uncharacterized OsmC-like protein